MRNSTLVAINGGDEMCGPATSRMSDVTITERIVAFRQNPSPARLLAAAAAIIRQGRVLEVLYTSCVLPLSRPSPVERTPDAVAPFALAAERLRFGETSTLAAWSAGFPRLVRLPAGIIVRLHTVADVGRYTVAAEYAEADPRLFLVDDRSCTQSSHYRGARGVRHIHCVHPLSDGRFVVTTGDSLRAADLWSIEAGRLRFERRLLRFHGGFTAAATVRGRSYFGSDYSGRPNYLWRLDDGRRFPLPADCFRMFVDWMEPIDDRYILIICKTLAAAGGGRRPAIFDAERQSFIAPP